MLRKYSKEVFESFRGVKLAVVVCKGRSFYDEGACEGGVKVRVLGYLWNREFFKKEGIGCGGFILVYEDTVSFRHL